MFDVGTVFIIGSSFSFFPLLWLLNRLSRRRLRRADRPESGAPIDPDQLAFLATLKYEGFERAAKAIELARKDLEWRARACSASSGRREPDPLRAEPDIPELTRERLTECVSLVDSLFSPRTAMRFREIIGALEADYRSRRNQWASHAAAAVGLLRAELHDSRPQRALEGDARLEA